MENVFSQLPAPLQAALAKAFDIHEPLQAQADSFASIFEGRDVVLQSRTGSGKTLAYLLPLMAKLTPGENTNRLLIVAPTQELAVQIANVIRALNAALEVPYSLALIGGGANIHHQIDKLKKHPAILVGTPGRILELFDRHKINGQTIEAVVFDEVDAIMEQEHGRLMSYIKKALRKSTQTIAVSASISMEIQHLLRRNMSEAEFLLANEEAALNPNIQHFILRCEQRKKFDILRRALHAMDGKTLIFINGDDDILHLQDRLAYHHIEAEALSADMKKLQRQHALESFRNGFEGTLISSDLSARGLDIDDIDQVINMDFPHDPLTYVHRVGRTGRGLADGAALSFVSDKDEAAIRIYKRDLGITFTEVHFADGAIVIGPDPRKNNEEGAPSKKNNNKKRKSKDKGKPKHKKRSDA